LVGQSVAEANAEPDIAETRAGNGITSVSRQILAAATIVLVGLTLAVLAALAAGGPAPAAPACGRADFAVAIDVGHFPAAPGAISARGVPELTFNRQLAAALLAALQRAGFTRAHLLDPDGTMPTLPERVARLRALAPPLLLSIHHDSVQPRYLEPWTWHGEPHRHSERFHGFSLFVSRRNGDFAASLAAAERIGEQLVAAGFTPSLHHGEDIDGERRPLLDRRYGLFAGDGLAILAHDPTPAVLIEAGIIVNRDEEAVLASPAFRHRFAAAVTAATAAFCASDGERAAAPRRAGDE
jgi:N-acetylmuramoyl-L-alanine amidase